MSAILSADDLNDFISPGVACIKPVETLPRQAPQDPSNPYEVTTEEQVASSTAPPARISLTDCLACSGCVTSAEAVLVSLQSHQEVLSTLDAYPSLQVADDEGFADDGRIFVASVSPQTRANIAAAYSVTEFEAGCMIEQLLSGPDGLKSGGKCGSGFTWVIDTNALREICQYAVIEEATGGTEQTPIQNDSINGHAHDRPKGPILASACPGWICYAEKTHPHVLPHLSRAKSPQALCGTLLKSVLSRRLGVDPSRIWHLAIMPCFDKKLEASREELTDIYWRTSPQKGNGVRDVDCVITARELVMLADARGIRFPNLRKKPLEKRIPFPDPVVDEFLFSRRRRRWRRSEREGGTSGSYAYNVLEALQRRHSGSQIETERGRNADVIDYKLIAATGETIIRTARYYGFRNIQNLVRRLRPQKKSRLPGSRLAAGGQLAGSENQRGDRANGSGAGAARAMAEYAYIEVMACPGGCTNGGGQIKASDLAELRGVQENGPKVGPAEQREWLAKVDEAYYSAESSDDELPADVMDVQDERESNRDDAEEGAELDGHVAKFLRYWEYDTGIRLDRLLLTTYRQVESDVGKQKGASEMERVAGLASSLGGGW